MIKRILGSTGITIASIVLGGNVFGWTIDEKTSFEVLDAFVDHGFDAIDTADCYSNWVPGNQGGESETIIGKWLKARPGVRDKVKIITRVGSDLGTPGQKGLSERWLLQAVEGSLSRLGIEQIDVYFSHWPDPSVGYEETLTAYDKLLKAGKIKAIGASNYDATLLKTALEVAKANGLPAYQVLEPEYNLYDRAAFDGALRNLCIVENIGVITYYSLASGFLSGKYRSEADLGKSQRGQGIAKYMTARDQAILKALDEVSAEHGVEPAQIALAWLIAREGLIAPTASATRVAHVEGFARAASLQLSVDQIAQLDRVSA